MVFPLSCPDIIAGFDNDNRVLPHKIRKEAYFVACEGVKIIDALIRVGIVRVGCCPI